MRTPEYLSPSSISKFEESPEKFYTQYLCDIRNPKPPQEAYMAVGSAVDAFAKSTIHEAIFGSKATKGSKFEFQRLFESQVEAHVRDEVMDIATDVWNQYQQCGAFANLLADVQKSPIEPRMEFSVVGAVQDVPLKGKPDLLYYTPSMVKVVTDWKINGSTSKTGASPMQGYKVCLDYGSNTHGKSHKKYKPFQFKGIEINEAFLEEFVPYWADQLSIYGWILGEPVGSEEFVIRMEQGACRPDKKQGGIRVKFATHMSRCSKRYQEKLMCRIHDVWNTIMSGHIFLELTREESDMKCQMLDGQAATPKEMHPVLGEYLNETTRFKPNMAGK